MDTANELISERNIIEKRYFQNTFNFYKGVLKYIIFFFKKIFILNLVKIDYFRFYHFYDNQRSEVIQKHLGAA